MGFVVDNGVVNVSDRYTILQHNTNIFVAEDCPLILTSHALTKDNQTGNVFIQCRFENVGSKSIKALNIDVLCSDITSQKLEGVENYTYLDIDVEQYQTFGDKTPVYLPDKAARNISIVPTKVVYVDGSTWDNKSSASFERLDFTRKSISELGELCEQYKRELHNICAHSDKHNYLPARREGFIICGCGKVVLKDARSCPSCGVDFNKLFPLNDSDKLQEALEQYKQEQAEREGQEKEKRKKQEIKRRRYLKIGISAAFIVLIAFGICNVIAHMVYQNRFEKSQVAISAGDLHHSLGIQPDGTVVATGDNRYSQCDVDDWTDIIAVSAGRTHSLGLKSDGTVVAAGNNNCGQCDVDDWTDIVAIDTGASYSSHESHSLGLKSDGTVVATGHNGYGQCDVDDWTDIIAISAGASDLLGQSYSLGLKSDGTVIATGSNEYGQCDVDDWTDIIAISTGYLHSLGLKSDGTVIATGYNYYGQCDVDDWTDIIAISAGDSHSLGLKSDGTVVATGYNSDFQCDGVAEWRNIIAVSAGYEYSLGVQSDGQVVAVGDNYYGQCDVEDWNLW